MIAYAHFYQLTDTTISRGIRKDIQMPGMLLTGAEVIDGLYARQPRRYEEQASINRRLHMRWSIIHITRMASTTSSESVKTARDKGDNDEQGLYFGVVYWMLDPDLA